MLSYFEISKLKDRETIEKALLYRGGFINEKDGSPSDFDFSFRMSKTQWEYKGIRPANFPERRIEGISHLLATSIKSGTVNLFYERIRLEANNQNPKTALRKIMDFEGIGLQRKEEMFFNILLPFFIAYTDSTKYKEFLEFIFASIKENSSIKDFRKKFPNKTLSMIKEYMGTIYFVKNKQS